MKRILAGLALALLIASPVTAKAGAAIEAAPGPYTFGQTVPTLDLVVSWTPRHGPQPDAGYWARAECYQAGSLVYAQFQSLSTTGQQNGWTLGPTSSWTGGAAECTVRLASLDNGVFRYLATDTFSVGP